MRRIAAACAVCVCASTALASTVTTAIYDFKSPGSGVVSSIEISSAAYFAGFADSSIPGQIIGFTWHDTPGDGGIPSYAVQVTTQLSALYEDRFTLQLDPGKAFIQTFASYDNGHYIDPQVTFWSNEVGYAAARISNMNSRIVNMSIPSDLITWSGNWQLRAVPTPEPTTLSLLAAALLPLGRPRTRRTGVISVA